MSINSRLQEALEPIVPEVVPGIYTGEAAEYISYTYTEIPMDFGDDEPHGIRYLITARWYFPADGSNPLAKKRQICRALRDAGFIYPTVTPLDDEVSRCYAFETEDVDGDV